MSIASTVCNCHGNSQSFNYLRKTYFYQFKFGDLRSIAVGIAFQGSRLELGYAFSLGLSFLVGGSILKTTITPSWNDIGQLAAIIVLRTVLNYLLLQAIDKSGNNLGGQSPSSDEHSDLSLSLKR